MTKKWTERSDTEIYALMIAIFVGMGVAIGTATDNLGAWIAIGTGLAVACAEGVRADKRKRDRKDP